ncbi:MAG: methyltransferase [Solirubrobacteraceae bacterium]|nr:methyltransferase [Solirubrobacteraceae bacterium]
MRILTLPGVFQPRSDTWLLADGLREQTLPPRAAVLDLCTGSGALAICAARRGARDVTAVDVSRRAVWTVRLNARLAGVRVRAVRGDLFAAVAGRRFDAIVSNPPYVPAPEAELPRRGARRAWDAGLDGRALLDRICAQAPAHLRPGGVVLLVHSSVCGTERTLELLRAGGLEAEVVARHRGPLGPLLRDRVEALEARGLLERGRREEEVVVVRGRAPARTGRARAPNGAAPAAR